MTARSPLAGFSLPGSSVHGGVRGRELPFLSQCSVRSADPTVLPGVGAVAHLDGIAVLGLGPDEWLAVGPPGDADRIADRLRPHGSIVDVSAARTTIELSGSGVRPLLAHGCALDLDQLTVGRCAQTMLAHAQVILWLTGQDEVRVLVRASFARYLADWLLDASTELNHES